MPIYDLSYQSWQGEYRKGARLLPILREGFLYGLRSKWLKLLYFLSWGPFIVFAGILFFKYHAELFLPAGKEVLGQLIFDLKYYHKFIQIPQQIAMVILVAKIGPGLITEDRRVNALELYLSRPVTRWDYLLGKVGAQTIFLMSVTFLPALGLWAMDCLFAPDISRFLSIWHYPLRFLAYTTILCTGTALFVLALGSMTRSVTMGSIYWVVIFGVSFILGKSIMEATNDNQYLLFCYPLVYDTIARSIFAIPLDPEVNPPWEGAVIVVAGLYLFSLIILLRRLRGTEVFR